jgi:diadenosine tetraphosphate (Ap4A) HIT family hydrolase
MVFESEYWRVTLAREQSYLGRAYVTAREHRASLPELTTDQWLDLKAVMARYEAAVREAFGADLFNWSCLMNDAFKAEQPEPHVHWHVRPRYQTAPVVNGVSYPDPNFAHQHDRQASRLVSGGELARIAQAIWA